MAQRNLNYEGYQIQYFLIISTSLDFSRTFIMCSISREQVICIFYCKEFNEENVHWFLKKIVKLEELELCYDDDPKHPLE